MSTTASPDSVAVFDHPNNIRRGYGRIVYAKATTDNQGHYHPEGWVLPGGQRTALRARAEAVADQIHRLSLR
jgi:hypothetical protein